MSQDYNKHNIALRITHMITPVFLSYIPYHQTDSINVKSFSDYIYYCVHEVLEKLHTIYSAEQMPSDICIACYTLAMKIEVSNGVKLEDDESLIMFATLQYFLDEMRWNSNSYQLQISDLDVIPIISDIVKSQLDLLLNEVENL